MIKTNRSADRLLLEQKSLYELPEADDIDINDLNNFAHNEQMGGRWLQHPEDTIWETLEEKGGKFKAQQRDLVRLSGSERYVDPFTRWLWGPCLQFVHQIYSKFKVVSFSPDTLRKAANRPSDWRQLRWSYSLRLSKFQRHRKSSEQCRSGSTSDCLHYCALLHQ
jgi:hypothetical protein